MDQLHGVAGSNSASGITVEGCPTGSVTSQPPNVQSNAPHQKLRNIFRPNVRTNQRTRELECELASAVQQLEAFRAVIRQQGSIDPPFVPLNSATPPPDYASQTSDVEITVVHPTPVRTKPRSNVP